MITREFFVNEINGSVYALHLMDEGIISRMDSKYILDDKKLVKEIVDELFDKIEGKWMYKTAVTEYFQSPENFKLFQMFIMKNGYFSVGFVTKLKNIKTPSGLDGGNLKEFNVCTYAEFGFRYDGEIFEFIIKCTRRLDKKESLYHGTSHSEEVKIPLMCPEKWFFTDYEKEVEEEE